jgi:basic membrane protein A
MKRRGASAFGAEFLGAALVLAGIGAPHPAVAEPLRPAILYNLVKFDASFNEGAYRGIERFKSATGTEFREFEVKSDVEREAVLRRFASRGEDPIIAIGFPFVSAVDKVARDFPKTRFVIVDAVVDRPNVQSVVFKEQEGGYLVGMMAAMASKTGKVGMVGGMDLPIIRRIACGYEKGAKAARPGTVVLETYAGDTPAAFTDPARGAELARSEIGQGADVVLQAARRGRRQGARHRFGFEPERALSRLRPYEPAQAHRQCRVSCASGCRGGEMASRGAPPRRR